MPETRQKVLLIVCNISGNLLGNYIWPLQWPCISRTVLLKIWIQNLGCALSTGQTELWFLTTQFVFTKIPKDVTE